MVVVALLVCELDRVFSDTFIYGYMRYGSGCKIVARGRRIDFTQLKKNSTLVL